MRRFRIVTGRALIGRSSFATPVGATAVPAAAGRECSHDPRNDLSTFGSASALDRARKASGYWVVRGLAQHAVAWSGGLRRGDPLQARRAGSRC